MLWRRPCVCACMGRGFSVSWVTFLPLSIPTMVSMKKKAAAPPTGMVCAPSFAVEGMIATVWPDSNLAVVMAAAVPVGC